MKEIWKDVVGYEGLYQISNLGNIKSTKRIIEVKNRGYRKKEEKLLHPFLQRSGYYAIVLNKKRKEFKLKYIHRLVAEAFIDNSSNLEQVNHKNGNKLDNNIENLEWCSRSDNIKHAIKTGLITQENIFKRLEKAYKKIKKPIYQIYNGKIIAEYESATSAGLQFSKCAGNNINACARGKIPSAYGYQWKYINQDNR